MLSVSSIFSSVMGLLQAPLCILYIFTALCSCFLSVPTLKAMCSPTPAMGFYIETNFCHIASPPKLKEQLSSCSLPRILVCPRKKKLSPLILEQQIHAPTNCLIQLSSLLGAICLPMTTLFVFYFSASHFSSFVCFYHATCASHFPHSFIPLFCVRARGDRV